MEMDRPSVAFAHMMDRAVVEDESRSPSDAGRMFLVCDDCAGSICEIEPGDSIRTLVNTALAHEC